MFVWFMHYISIYLAASDLMHLFYRKINNVLLPQQNFFFASFQINQLLSYGVFAILITTPGRWRKHNRILKTFNLRTKKKKDETDLRSETRFLFDQKLIKSDSGLICSGIYGTWAKLAKLWLTIRVPQVFYCHQVTFLVQEWGSRRRKYNTNEIRALTMFPNYS